MPTNVSLQLRVQLPSATPVADGAWVTPASLPAVWPYARLLKLATSKAVAAICRANNFPLPTVAPHVLARGTMLILHLTCHPDLAEILQNRPCNLFPIPFPTAPNLHGLMGYGQDAIMSKFRLVRLDPGITDEALVSLMGEHGINVARLTRPDGVQPSQGEADQGAVSLGLSTTAEILVSGPGRPPREAQLVGNVNGVERVRVVRFDPIPPPHRLSPLSPEDMDRIKRGFPDSPPPRHTTVPNTSRGQIQEDLRPYTLVWAGPARSSASPRWTTGRRWQHPSCCVWDWRQPWD